MNRPKSFIALLLAILIFACSIPVASQTESQPGGPSNDARKVPKLDFVPGEILIRFRNEAQAKIRERSNMSVSSEGRAIQISVKEFKGSELVEGLRIARVAPADTLQAIAELNSHPDVLYAEPNYVRRINRLPNDPRFSELWGLRNAAQGVDIDAETAWNTTTGSRSVVVGVVDEGIDINHEDLRDNIWYNPGETANDGIDNDGNGYVDDVNGWDFHHNDKTVFDGTGTYPADETDSHGTHVAGTIGARGDNGIGVTGVNWQVSLMSLKILGTGGGSSESSVNAYTYAGKMRELWENSGGTKGANIRVLNNSYGGYGHSQAELDAIRALGDRGILFVVSAGNEGYNNDTIPSYPSGYIATNLISVAATNSSDLRPSFSNFGPATVNMAAPGTGILSTTPNNTYDFYNGTSMAAPHVAGVAALVCTAFPNISVRRLRSALLYSGEVLSNQVYYQHLSSGRRLNAANALQNAGSADSTAPAAPPIHYINQSWNNRNVYLTWKATGDDGDSGQAAAYEIRFSETDLTNPAAFEMARPLPVTLLPNPPGSFENWSTDLPWRHTAGFVGIRAVDEVGNAGPITSVPVNISPHINDPYTVAKSAPGALSTGGTPIVLVGDDVYKNYSLPFTFPFFINGSTYQSVTVSSNGALYLSFAPTYNNQPDDAVSSESRLQGYRMIAGLWDDLRTDRRSGDDVYVVKPDADRIIFRWQAVTYNTPLSATQSRGEHPVNFEIELRRDGTIQVRYGDGNQRLLPVVGISGGNPDAYVVDSHTSPFALKNLGNAETITYSMRAPIEQPAPSPTPTPVPTPTPIPTPIPGLSGKVVFAGSTNGVSNIFVMNADGLDEVKLTDGQTFYSTPEWSPDGTKIAFNKGGYIHVMDHDGGNLRRLTNNNVIESDPSWSPDGTKILFAAGQLSLINLDGSNQVTINGGPCYEAKFSPDGTKILCKDSALTDNSQLWVMNADGTNRKQLTDIPGGKHTAKWSPDGKRIVFSNYRITSSIVSEIYIMNADGTMLMRVTYNYNDQYPTWSPDSTRIMFSRNGLYHVMYTGGTNIIQLNNLSRNKAYLSWTANTGTPTPPPVGNTIQLSQPSYTFHEGTLNSPQGYGALSVTVLRGDKTSAATVQYFTSDQSGGSECNQVTGKASQRCDYATTAGTLRFAPGEDRKQIQIPIVRDGYIEGPEVFTIGLQNPSGTALGAIPQANITIQDRGVATLPSENPYMSPAFFVRQNYLDFLGRDADQAGFMDWTNVLNNCGPNQGFLGAPYNCDRAHVSHGFFASDEFTNRGYLIYRMYEVGKGRLPRYAEFIPDLATLSGFDIPESVRQQNLADYLQRFTSRAEVIDRFTGALQPSQAAPLILKMEQTAGLTLPETVTTRPGQPQQYGRQELINLRASGQFTVGQTLKAFVEQQDVYDKYFARGFVTMEYFGYLRRDPDLNDPNLTGWNEWVYVFTNGGATRGRPDILPRDYHHLIFGFIYSEEYRKRFGQP